MIKPTKKKNIADNPARKTKHDFKMLNQQFNEAYRKFKTDTEEANRIALYESIHNLSLACLQVSMFRHNPPDDLRLIATEFAFTQLNRIMASEFIPEPKVKGTLFPANHYFSLAIQRPAKEYFTFDHPSKRWQRLHVLIEDLELFVRGNPGSVTGDNDYDPHRTANIITGKEYARDLFNALRLLYSDLEIRRLLPLACEMLFVSDITNLSKSTIKSTMDLKIFMDVLIVCAQRIANEHNITADINIPKADLTRALDSSLRSTLFLSAVSNYDRVPRDLLLALDHRSLYRLAYILGGSSIRIPTVRDLQFLQNAVNAAVTVYMAPEADKKKAMQAVSSYNQVFHKKNSCIHIDELVSKMVASNTILKNETASTPLINVVLAGIQALDILVKNIHARKVSPDDTLNQYVVLSKSLTDIVDRIISLEGQYAPT